MNFKLSKSGRISDWEIRVISGLSFTFSMMLMHLLVHFIDPQIYGLFDQGYAIFYILSAPIVGGYFGPGIFKAVYEEKYLVKLLKSVFFIFICEAFVFAFLLAIPSLFFPQGLMTADVVLVGMFIVLSIFYGIWRVAQIVITVSILFLGFRYIRDREPRE